MNTFQLHLQSATQNEKINDVISFMAEDRTGQFGILANHARFMTTLVYGLAKYITQKHETEYLVLPGGLLYFVNNQLYISTRHYLRNNNYQTLLIIMDKELNIEDEKIRSTKESLHRLDEEILKRLLTLKQQNYYEVR